MINIWIPEQELIQRFRDNVQSVRFSDVYLKITNPNNQEAVLAVGGGLKEAPRDFETRVLEAYFQIGTLNHRSLRFCRAYDVVFEIPVAPDKNIPISYVMSFVHEPHASGFQDEDRATFQRIENIVPTLNEWVLFNLLISKDGYNSKIGEYPFSRYQQTIIDIKRSTQ